MAENYNWIVDVEVINPYGMCLGEDLPREEYNPYVEYWHHGNNGTASPDNLAFFSYQGRRSGPSSFIPLWTYSYSITAIDRGLNLSFMDYFIQAYNIPEDKYRSFVPFPFGRWSFNRVAQQLGSTENANHQRTFKTQAEALEYVDTLGNPDPIHVVRNDTSICNAVWEEEIDGIWIERTGELRYTGDEVSLYTINDFKNFFALALGLPSDHFFVRRRLASGLDEAAHTPRPEYDCNPYLKATIIDATRPVDLIEIDIDFTGGSIPGDVTVTVVDGDPIVPTTMIENGPGSVTISDNGNILMLNEGGTFFLNEFGNVGFYANGDASLTADNQVQLGVGQNSITVENGSLTIRDETGSATLTAEDINRLKETLT